MATDANGNWIPDPINSQYSPASWGQNNTAQPSAVPATNSMSNWGQLPQGTAQQSPMQPNIPTATTGGTGGGTTGNWWDGILGSEGNQGWGGTALQGVGALANSWLGFQNLGVAKDQLAENQRQFDLNYSEQKANQDQYYADRGDARKAAFGTA